MRHDTVQTLKRPILLDLSSAASLSRMSSALNFSLTISLSLGTKSERRFHLGLFAFFHSVRLKVITKIQKASKPFQSRVIWRMNTAILRFNLELSQQYPRSPPIPSPGNVWNLVIWGKRIGGSFIGRGEQFDSQRR